MALALKHERDDGALLDDLARLIERLRLVRYHSIVFQVEDAPALLVEEFADLFSRHLLYEEEILFPVLREPAPREAGRKLEELRHEHGKLREFVEELVGRVRVQDVDGACRTGRLFMAALLEHIGRETRVTRDLVSELDSLAAAKLRRLLDLERGTE
jgi:iron-sulfur cluster repair protein YtfE (RIC family)